MNSRGQSLRQITPSLGLGPLDRWATGQLDRWTAGQLDNWTAGPLDNWTTGPLDRRTATTANSIVVADRDRTRDG